MKMLMSVGLSIICLRMWAGYNDFYGGEEFTEQVNGVTWRFVKRTASWDWSGETMEAVIVSTPTPCTGHVTIPATLGGVEVGSIGLDVFYRCAGLTSITIPSSVRVAAMGSFDGCSNLKDVFIDDLEAWCRTGFSTNPLKYADRLLLNGVEVHEVVCVPITGDYDFERTMSGCSFSGFSGLNSVMIPSSIREVDAHAFEKCIGLKTVTICEGVTCIGTAAFNGCCALSSINFPMSIATIEEDAFRDCSSLSTIRVSKGDGERIKGLLLGAGVDCSNVQVIEGVSTWTFEDGFMARLDEGGTLTISGEGEFPANWRQDEKWLPWYVLRNSIFSVRIPHGVTYLPSYFFVGCKRLTSVSIPSSVSSYSYPVFKDCDSIETVLVDDYDPWNHARGVLESSGIDCTKIKFIREVWRLTDTMSATLYANHTLSIDGSGDMPNWQVITEDDYGYKRMRSTAPWGHMSGGIEKVEISDGVTSVGDNAFYGCNWMTAVSIGDDVRTIGKCSFAECERLQSVLIPKNVSCIGDNAFSGVRAVTFCSDHPILSLGEEWCGDALVRFNLLYEEEWSEALKGCKNKQGILTPDMVKKVMAGLSTVHVTVTNVVVHYVLNSVKPDLAIPAAQDTGFVNVITEVKGGCMSVPSSWTVNYPKFTEKFGSDFTKALAMQTGKKDGAGNPMFVWQDYVAGTDPTDETDVFSASITIVDGKVTVSYSPELDDARKALRKYTTWGKAKLTDKDWSVVGEGEEGNFNFFKVTVEMR